MTKVGSEVGWLWAGLPATGIVKEIHPYRHEIITKGKSTVRNGTEQDSVLVIEHTKGPMILRLSYEVRELSDIIKKGQSGSNL